MKIYFLRHEDRYPTISFFTPLNHNGKTNAIKLVKDLEKIKITKVYSSPYLRTLQTIEPFINSNKISVNLENSLRETNILNGIPEKEKSMELPIELYKQFSINKDYKSYLKIEDVMYPETMDVVKSRFNKFLKHLIEKYHKTNERILLVSHSGIIEGLIRKMEKKEDLKILKKIKPYHYPLGKITLIVDEKRLVFKEENWSLEKI